MPAPGVRVGILLPTREAVMSGRPEAGARHVVLRFAGPDQLDQLERATTGLLPGLRAS